MVLLQRQKKKNFATVGIFIYFDCKAPFGKPFFFMSSAMMGRWVW